LPVPKIHVVVLLLVACLGHQHLLALMLLASIVAATQKIQAGQKAEHIKEGRSTSSSVNQMEAKKYGNY
jgi:hypothetical protein